MNESNRRLHGLGLDLVVVGVLTVLAVGALLSPLHGSSLALLLAIPFLLFTPGYALLAALFPERPDDPARASSRRRAHSPGWAVRLGLSLLVSALLVGVVGVLLDTLWSGIWLSSLVTVITVITFCGILIAAARRDRRPAADRANPFVGRGVGLLPGGTSLQSLTLGIAIVALVIATVFVGVTPAEGEHYSEAYLLSENENGELTAEGYPSTFVAGEGHQLSFGISNHEYEPVSYEVVVVAQEVGPDGEVTAQEQVDQFGATLDHGETTVLERQIAPTTTGDEIRLRFLVYKNTSPGSDVEPAHVLQLWIDVESAE